MKSKILYVTLILSIGLLLGLENQPAFAQEEVTITPLNEQISIKKTVVQMFIPEVNKFPWGVIRGEASEISERNPIIIQIYKGEDPVHFAQVNPYGDGSFEYMFRIRNVDSETGFGTNSYEGNYSIKIFRVIPTSSIIQ